MITEEFGLFLQSALAKGSIKEHKQTMDERLSMKEMLSEEEFKWFLEEV